MRLPDGRKPEITELTVVFLADKLLIGSEGVCLEKRYHEKMAAFGDQPSAVSVIRNQLKLSLNLERQIKTVLGVCSLLNLP